MTVNLLALCGFPNPVVKRIKTTAPVQSLLEGIFKEQEAKFFEAINQEIAFDGGWHPDKNELLYIDLPADIKAVFDQTGVTIVSLPEIDPQTFSKENIRALCVRMGTVQNAHLLIQNFSARQVLDHRVIIWDGNTFDKLTAPAFTLGSSLAGVIVGGKLKFQSYNNIRMVFDLKHFYLEATDGEIDAFSAHGKISLEDAAAFKANADQTTRKLIYALTKRRILDAHSADAIAESAATQGLKIETKNQKIVFPPDKKGAKEILHFLDDGFYKAPLTGKQYITNSKRVV